MNGSRFITLGAVGAVACVGVCAAAALVPAVLAGGGVALLLDEIAGWQVALGAVLVVGAAIWWWRVRRSRAQRSCGCAGNAPSQEGSR